MTTTNDDIFKGIEETAAELAAARKKHITAGKEILKKAFAAIFEKYPDVRAITWTQYTPYFNDGDACVFSVGDMWILDEAGYKSWQDDGGGYAEEYACTRWNYNREDYESPLSNEQVDEIEDFLSRLRSTVGDDVFEKMFGDHAEITAEREGFKVEEYRHD